MRLGVYTDYVYARAGGTIHAERAFSLFLVRLAARLEGMTLIGRLNPDPSRTRYPIPPQIRFVGLPYYESLVRPLPFLRSTLESLRRYWRALDDVDAVWLIGPHPLAIAFALVATLRRRRIFLGVRADFPVYVRSRHPGRRSIHLAADAIDAAWRALGRRCPIIVVGPELRRRYRHARHLLEIQVSLVAADDVVEAEEVRSRPYDGELKLLSVGRLAEEKNPVALADILAELSVRDEDRWRLVVCGEGPLEEALSARLAKLGFAERAELRGYVPAGALREVYRSSHFLIHTSWTEGLPQVLIEACAAGLPVVATDVGGIRDALGDAAILVPAGDVEAAARAVRGLVDDPQARNRLIDAGLIYARRHTMDHEVGRLAEFVASHARAA